MEISLYQIIDAIRIRRQAEKALKEQEDARVSSFNRKIEVALREIAKGIADSYDMKLVESVVEHPCRLRLYELYKGHERLGFIDFHRHEIEVAAGSWEKIEFPLSINISPAFDDVEKRIVTFFATCFFEHANIIPAREYLRGGKARSKSKIHAENPQEALYA